MNTLMLQDVLAEPAWLACLHPPTRGHTACRDMCPPRGEVRLDMTSRLFLGTPTT
ncbi:hypothetical protein [Streptomyces sp. 1222.5]|uniref:hypothetical protein n=1 Tax=Streptomyces sp. 1222.5 TaxID=1881026 RepID=UPI003F49F768